MMRRYATWITSLAIVLSGCGGPLVVRDLAPDSNATDPATAGRTIGLAGDQDALYAVSLNAGVWRTSREFNGDEKPWEQLPASPRFAFSIAVDPSTSGHVAIGERNGEATRSVDNHSGVWETFDGGQTFPAQFYFDPTRFPGTNGCSGSQAIPSVAFARTTGTLVAATACGVAVKRAGTWSFPATPLGRNAITAVTASETKLWARDAAGNVIVSNTDGVSWATTATPTPAGLSFRARGETFALPEFPAMGDQLGVTIRN
jgi:hypothetical protein